MARVLKRVQGTAAGGDFAAGDKVTLSNDLNPMKWYLDLLGLGIIRRDVYVGGSDDIALDASATGDLRVAGWRDIEVDNTNNQYSGFSDVSFGASLVVRFKYKVRVSDSGTTITPKIFYGSSPSAMTSVATISGAVACSATNADYSGSNQRQLITVTLPSGLKYFVAAVTIGGTPAAGDVAWANVSHDLFVQS